MTEYTSSPEAIRQFYAAVDRTKLWVSTVKEQDDFHSPSIPRSELSDDEDDNISVSVVSDGESTHSVPPRLMLRYGDGRADVMIPHVHDNLYRKPTQASVARSQTTPLPVPPPGYHNQAGQQQQSAQMMPSQPEEIRILPSRPVGSGSQTVRSRMPSQQSHHSQQPQNHVRSKSLPKDAFAPHPSQFLSGQQHQQQRRHHRERHPQIASSTSSSPWHSIPASQLPRGRKPPSIVYASGRSANLGNYHPPAMYSHPPHVGPNGVVYSHSAPVPGPYRQPGPPPGQSHSKKSKSKTPTRSGSTKSRKGGRERPMTPGFNGAGGSPTLSTPSLVPSEESGSTYYVMPTGKQKVHILRPPDLILDEGYSPTSTSPITPASSSTSKRSIFARLFSPFSRFGSFSAHSNANSSTAGVGGGNGKRLHRRYSEGSRDRPHMRR